MNNLDYAKLYAERLKEDNSLFKQQKSLIESQYKASSSFFQNMFSKSNFKKDARKYLKSVGLI
tara:strand:+ start:2704 stop:2892 length:189 start_codon:yes stop_codon:yes gene_type:complete